MTSDPLAKQWLLLILAPAIGRKLTKSRLRRVGRQSTGSSAGSTCHTTSQDEGGLNRRQAANGKHVTKNTARFGLSDSRLAFASGRPTKVTGLPREASRTNSAFRHGLLSPGHLLPHTSAFRMQIRGECKGAHREEILRLASTATLSEWGSFARVEHKATTRTGGLAKTSRHISHESQERGGYIHAHRLHASWLACATFGEESLALPDDVAPTRRGSCHGLARPSILPGTSAPPRGQPTGQPLLSSRIRLGSI